MDFRDSVYFSRGSSTGGSGGRYPIRDIGENLFRGQVVDFPPVKFYGGGEVAWKNYLSRGTEKTMKGKDALDPFHTKKGTKLYLRNSLKRSGPKYTR